VPVAREGESGFNRGDVVKCLPGIAHWHGALPGAKLTHIAIGPDAEKGNALWLQAVTNEEYNGTR
jgi:quercetin dioxygenase-like cupin family protein